MFDSLRDGHSLDLDSRKGKAPGGYQISFDRIRRPFIFMNATGLQRDLETMVNEAGHAFHAMYSSKQDLIDNRDPPIEFAEVASMSMELLYILISMNSILNTMQIEHDVYISKEL